MNEVSLPKISDGYGRLNVWGANAGAVRSGRGSLDDNLRNEKKLQSIIHDILTELIDVLRSGTSPLEFPASKFLELPLNGS